MQWSVFVYDTKTVSNGETPYLELWTVWSISSLPLLPVPLYCGIFVPVNFLSMSQVILFENY